MHILTPINSSNGFPVEKVKRNALSGKRADDLQSPKHPSQNDDEFEKVKFKLELEICSYIRLYTPLVGIILYEQKFAFIDLEYFYNHWLIIC